MFINLRNRPFHTQVWLLGLLINLFFELHLVAYDWSPHIEEYKPMVVNIETASEIVFGLESKGISFATGFIIDSERGIIATNQHVTGSSPSYVKINFHDGSFTQARLLYYDPTHDFGFYQIDPETVLFDMKSVSLGSWRNLSIGEDLLLIGNNEKEEYSIKYGNVANLNVDKGDRHSSYLHTTFDRTGGSSGSPVWNTSGEVVAIHARGTDTSSFELPIDYLKSALLKLQQIQPIQRGEIGVDLELISIGEAIRHFRLPESCRKEIGRPATGTPRVIQIESIIPLSTGVDRLRASDIIYRINDILIRDDLYQFDEILDQHVDQTVRLDVYRNGKLVPIEVLVDDLEKQKVRKFVRFGGAIFHEITPQLRHLLYVDIDGIYMSFSEAGSSFSQVGRRDRSGNSKIVILEINGNPTKNLADFIVACQNIQDGEHTYVVVRDFNQFNVSPTPKSLTINLKFGPLETFEWSDQRLDWIVIN